MNEQFDKKVNPITKSFKVNDEVLIENVSRMRSKGGMLQDKWIGPYPITKVSTKMLQDLFTFLINTIYKDIQTFLQIRIWIQHSIQFTLSTDKQTDKQTDNH